jgi:hypothetical protein
MNYYSSDDLGKINEIRIECFYKNKDQSENNSHWNNIINEFGDKGKESSYKND